VVNGSEIRDIDVRGAVRGEGLRWKLAMWGSHRDRRLLEAVCSRFDPLATVAGRRGLAIHSGFEPRASGTLIRKIVGKKWIKKNALRGFDRLFAFPDSVFETFPEHLAHARPGRDDLPIVVSRPPHVLCDASRRFAVYSDEFIVVRARQPAIAGPREQSRFLKLLALYLNSDFARYHQFLMAPQWGVFVNVSTLDTLKALPTPLSDLGQPEVGEWLTLHSRLVKASPKAPTKGPRRQVRKTSTRQQTLPFDVGKVNAGFSKLVKELNDRVYQLLELRETERMLVEDFVQYKRFANKGKLAEEAAGEPSAQELEEYAQVLKSELDGFFENDPNLRHRIGVQYDEDSLTAMVEVELLRRHRGPLRVKVERANAGMSADFERARQQMRAQQSQWLYFERNLRLYEGTRVFLLKPLQRIHWLRSQAVLDADTMIAEILTEEGA
jgi:hypothetical protein